MNGRHWVAVSVGGCRLLADDALGRQLLEEAVHRCCTAHEAVQRHHQGTARFQRWLLSFLGGRQDTELDSDDAVGKPYPFEFIDEFRILCHVSIPSLGRFSNMPL